MASRADLTVRADEPITLTPKNRAELVAVYQLAYCSACTSKVTADILDAILKVSQRNNVRDGITGILMYHDQTFFQVIEGDKDAVLELHERLKKDPRHAAVSVMWQGTVDERSFAKWTMGFAGPTVLPGYSRGVTVSLEDLKGGSDAISDSDRFAVQLAKAVHSGFVASSPHSI